MGVLPTKHRSNMANRIVVIFYFFFYHIISAGGAITFQVQKKIKKNAELCSPGIEIVGSISAITLDEEFRQSIRSCISHSRDFLK